MIKYNNKLWFKHIISLQKTDTLRVLFPELFIVALFTFGVCYVELHYVNNISRLSSVISIHSLVGFVLGLLLVFRTNSAYDRWWEGRKHWGALINTSRNFAIKIKTIWGVNSPVSIFFNAQISNFAFALKEHLRENRNLDELNLSAQQAAALKDVQHLPNFLVDEMSKKQRSEQNNNTIDSTQMLRLDRDLSAFLDITGACERIKNTPIPFSYSTFLKKFVFLYIATLPIGFIPNFQYWTIPVVMLIFYVLVSLEILAEEIEDPFGTDENDLPTDDLAQKIKGNVAEIFSTAGRDNV